MERVLVYSAVFFSWKRANKSASHGLGAAITLEPLFQAIDIVDTPCSTAAITLTLLFQGTHKVASLFQDTHYIGTTVPGH
jgi:hypothetical protein